MATEISNKELDTALDTASKIPDKKESIKTDLKSKIVPRTETKTETTKKGDKTVTKKVIKKTVKQPSDFINHPLAKAVNGVLDMATKMDKGTAQDCEVGQCIVLTLDYYNITPDHPIWYLAFSGGTFALTVMAEKGTDLFGLQLEKKDEKSEFKKEQHDLLKE